MGRRARCLLLLLVFVGGFGVAEAQTSPATPQTGTRTVNRAVSTVITVVIGVFFVLVFICVIVNQCCDCDSSAGAGARQSSAARRRRGLDQAAVAAIPVVPYAEIRKHRSGGVLECAVCLTAFDDGDDLRLLPQCSHAFHPDCIDPWLEGHVTCPLCRANLEKQPTPSPPVVELSSSPTAAAAEEEPRTLESAAERVEEVVVEASDEEETRRREEEEEAVELEMLRSVRRAARMPRSHSTGHSLCTLPARARAAAPAPGDGGDHERFTVRLPPQVREEVLKSRRLRHATSLVLGNRGSSREGSSRGGGGGGVGGSWHGARRWPSFLARTVSWARGGVGADTSAKETPRRDAV
uniref:RING-type E3 ubiquitin transferase n=1 Tax=Oryza punctata TaxID=4537 RepID=A0A0E0K1E5_ORYPU